METLILDSTVIYPGALTKGDQRAASGADLTEFNFDTPYGFADDVQRHL